MKYMKYKKKYIDLQNQYGGTKEYALIFMWINYSLDSKKNNTSEKIPDRTIYRGLGIDEFNKNILEKLLLWKKCHPTADIYLAYDSRMTDDVSIENTKEILDKYNIILFDLITLIDDEFITRIQEFMREYISITYGYTLLDKYNYGMSGTPNIDEYKKLKRRDINKYDDQLWYIKKEFILNYILGVLPISSGETSPLYFRVDMWRLILTLKLSIEYKYVVYSDIDVNPEQEYLSDRDKLFDEETKKILDSIGFVVCQKPTSEFYENGFHIMKKKDETYNGIITVCIYMNIIRFFMYMMNLFFTDSDNYCLEDIFKQIIFVSYEQLFVYLYYLTKQVKLYAKTRPNNEYIELNDLHSIIPLLGLNCRNIGTYTSKYSCEYLYYKKDDKYRMKLPRHEYPTKIVIIGNSTMTTAPCKKIKEYIAETGRYIE